MFGAQKEIFNDVLVINWQLLLRTQIKKCFSLIKKFTKKNLLYLLNQNLGLFNFTKEQYPTTLSYCTKFMAYVPNKTKTNILNPSKLINM